MALFSTSRVIGFAFLLLAIAAVVFAVWPHAQRQASLPTLPPPQATVTPAFDGTSTFGGTVARNRPDIRAGGLYKAPADGN